MEPKSRTPKLEASGVKRLLEILISAVVMSVLLFISAGRLDWWPAWAYLGSWILLLIGEYVWITFVNPDLIEVINMRGRTPKTLKPWDRILILYLPLPFLMAIVGGLDGGRFGWSSIPFLLQVLGFVMSLVGYVLGVWALFQNVPSLTTKVGIEKNMKICSTGPYAYIRHPMYAGVIIGFIGNPLLFGSYLALIPGFLLILIIIYRTIFEDRDLQAEVPAYRNYVKKVKFRLVPWVW